MTPTLIVLGFVALGVAIVAFATRQAPARPVVPQREPDTAWGDAPVDEQPKPDPFGHAPILQTVPELAKITERQS